MITQSLKATNAIHATINDKNKTEWVPPPYGHVKINIDASFKHNTGIGLIMHDSTGTCTAIRGEYSKGGLDAEEAFNTAVQWAKDLTLKQVVFEGDNVNIVQSINRDIFWVSWSNQSWIIDIRSSLNSIPKWQSTYVNRTTNNLADTVAKETRKLRNLFCTLTSLLILLTC